MDDAALLRSYANNGSENAFAELVRRYLPLVYGAALRRVGGDVHLAEDVTQLVFTALARDAGRLARHPNLAGWLFTTTRFLAAKTARSERRRQVREGIAARDQTADESGEEAAERLRPVLDDILTELRELDRQMLLMRFYRGFRLAEIAVQLNSSENAVQKRIERALERMNAMLSRRGITSTAAALSLAFEQHGAVALPAGLAAAATTAGLTCGSSGAGALATSAAVGIGKLQFYAAAVLVIASSAGAVWYYRENARLRAELASATVASQRLDVSKQPRPAAAAVPVVAATRPLAVADAPRPDGPPHPTANQSPPPQTVPVVRRQPRSTKPSPGEAKVPLKIDYPRPLFAGTPRPIQLPNLERAPVGKRPDFMVPIGTELLSRGSPVTSSDSHPVIGELSFVTDGDKTGTDGTYVELGPNPQWVQIDLGAPAHIAAIVVWHFHAQARVYHDVIVQISDDNDFKKGVTTVYNNDDDNSSKLGQGRDRAYVESHQGRIFDGKGATGRYVRLHSNGNTSDELNHYCEAEVHGQH